MSAREVVIRGLRMSRVDAELASDQLGRIVRDRLPAARARVEAARAEYLRAEAELELVVNEADEREKTQAVEANVQRELAMLLVDVELDGIPHTISIEDRVAEIRARAEIDAEVIDVEVVEGDDEIVEGGN